MSIYENRIVRLDFGEPSFLCPEEARAEAIKYILNPDCYYAPINGEELLISSITKHFKKNRNIIIDPQNITITTGGLMGINSIIRSLKKNGVTKVYYPDPGFPPYNFLGMYNDIISETYKMLSTNETLEELITIAKKNPPMSVLLIVTSPNNPNGLTFGEIEWGIINEKLLNQYILFDNSFESFIYSKDKDRLPPFNKNYFHVFSFSKTYALADYRIGFVISPSAEWNNILSREHWFSQLSTSVISQRAALGALNTKDNYRETNRIKIKNNIQDSVEYLLKEGIEVDIPEGGFFLWIDINKTGLTSLEFTNLALEQYKLSIVSGDRFGQFGNGYIRINCATDTLRLQEGLNRFVKCFKERIPRSEDTV